jgi:hypothetical protein
MAATEAGVMRMAKKAIWIGLLLTVTAGAVALARWLGLRPDPRTAQFLEAPGALEQLAGRSERQGSERARELKPPLVAQAEAFTLRLNPPKPPQRPAPVPRPRTLRPEVKPVAAPPPLRLMGISYHRSNPAESRALVGAPDGGCRWVKQGAEFGHLVIEKINRGSILYRDGGATQEMTLREFRGHHT